MELPPQFRLILRLENAEEDAITRTNPLWL